jgi:hypothetical protein
MKTGYLILYLILSVFNGYDLKKEDDKEIIISMKHSKRNMCETDTLRVSQNDITVFKQVENIVHRPCSNPELTIRYELINPKDGAYYYIYDTKGKLVLEGKYTKEYLYEGIIYKQGNFYNSKKYSYQNSGKLNTIHYQEDGRNLKTEVFDNKKKLKKVLYFDKKSSNKTKVEIYTNGQLHKTHIYTSFNNYYTVKANN